jgi:hypothetical protein
MATISFSKSITIWNVFQIFISISIVISVLLALVFTHDGKSNSKKNQSLKSPDTLMSAIMEVFD